MITEDYVSLETARLLKDKGFRCVTNRYYNAQYDEIRTVSDTFMMDWNDVERMKKLGMAGAISIPTLQMVMKWLRVVKNIQIEISIVGEEDKNHKVEKWVYGFRIQTTDIIDRHLATFTSYEEAANAAILYALENLI